MDKVDFGEYVVINGDYDLLDEHDLEISDLLEVLDEDVDALDGKSSDDIMRIEANLLAHWRGVKSCCKRDRAANEIYNRLARFRKSIVDQEVGYRYIRHGIVGGKATVKCKQHRNRWTRKRRCTGISYFDAYVEFVRN